MIRKISRDGDGGDGYDDGNGVERYRPDIYLASFTRI